MTVRNACMFREYKMCVHDANRDNANKRAVKYQTIRQTEWKCGNLNELSDAHLNKGAIMRKIACNLGIIELDHRYSTCWSHRHADCAARGRKTWCNENRGGEHVLAEYCEQLI